VNSRRRSCSTAVSRVIVERSGFIGFSKWGDPSCSNQWMLRVSAISSTGHQRVWRRSPCGFHRQPFPWRWRG
jgi:hypothetical protein